MQDPNASIETLLQQMRELGLQRRAAEALTAIDARLVAAASDPVELLQACRRAAVWHAAAMDGRDDDGLAEALAAIELLGHAGFEPHLAWLRDAAGFSIGRTRHPELGLQWIGKALATAQAQSDPIVQRSARVHLGVLHSMLGNHETADHLLRDAEDAGSTSPRDATPGTTDPGDRLERLNHRACNSVRWASSLPPDDPQRQALAAQAVALADEALAGPDGAAHRHGLAWSLANRAQGLAMLGRTDEAGRDYRACLPLAEPDPRIAAIALAGHARLLAETDRFDEGRVQLRKAFDVAPKQLLEPALDRVLEAGVLLETRAGDLEGLADWSERRHRRLQQQYRARLAEIQRLTGQLAAVEVEREAERAQAATTIRRDRQALDRVGAAYEVAAWNDLLTSLPNRTLGRIRLQQALDLAARQGRPLAVVSVGVDRFKEVNVRHGQGVGDAVLQLVAQRLATELRAADAICRLSGDQFLLTLPDVDEPEGVVRVLDRIRRQFAKPFEVGGHRIGLSLSFGVAWLHDLADPALDAEALMGRADVALLEAKTLRGGQHAFFEPQMSQRRRVRAQTREALSRALDRGEFEMHFQPKFALLENRLAGVEALLRWRHPEGHLVMPGDFIALAEDSGLIVPIGRWALAEACRAAARWQSTSPNGLVVAVNLSAAQFRLSRVIEDIDAALHDSGLPAERLEIELTESLLLRHDDEIGRTLDSLKQRGLQLTIDDFGTGYSNLAYLKRFAVDKLKIDRSFVVHMQRDERDRHIVQAIVHIARSLGTRTIAEGVEDDGQARMLREMGCDQAQGYLYGHPMPAPAFEDWLRQTAAGAP